MIDLYFFISVFTEATIAHFEATITHFEATTAHFEATRLTGFVCLNGTNVMLPQIPPIVPQIDMMSPQFFL
ncbi:hypothetical protein QYY11_000519 [Escherichia coli]|nr:hypothetical protein [Escherichia coli]ELB9134328.1 hypothetical protein [Escherichia coli]